MWKLFFKRHFRCLITRYFQPPPKVDSFYFTGFPTKQSYAKVPKNRIINVSLICILESWKAKMGVSTSTAFGERSHLYSQGFIWMKLAACCSIFFFWCISSGYAVWSEQNACVKKFLYLYESCSLPVQLSWAIPRVLRLSRMLCIKSSSRVTSSGQRAINQPKFFSAFLSILYA